MRRSDEEVTDEILLAGPHADPALPAPSLVPVCGNGRPLDVAGVADRDRHVLLGNQVLDAEIALLLDDLRPAVVAVFRLQGPQLVDDRLHQQPVAGQDRPEALDRLQQLGQLIQNLLPFQPGQPLELHVEDGLRLDLAEGELGHQAGARLGHGLRRPGSA